MYGVTGIRNKVVWKNWKRNQFQMPELLQSESARRPELLQSESARRPELLHSESASLVVAVAVVVARKESRLCR